VSSSDDGDAFLEPPERGLVRVRAVNLGGATATGVVATLRSTTPGIRITPVARSFGDLPPGVARVRRFRVQVPATFEAGDVVPVEAEVRFPGAFSPGLSAGTFRLGEPSKRVVTAAYTGPDVPIPDADPSGVRVDLPPVRGLGRVSEVTFSVDGSDCAANVDTSVGLAHTFVGDLVGTLTSPDGTTATLFERSGGTGRNLCRVRFADTAGASFSQATSTQEPFTGSWRPAQPLSVFFGTEGDGVWTFEVADLAGADTGAVRKVSVHLRGFVGGG
jgi:subtilisin-like proprotein convertase family protein